LPDKQTESQKAHKRSGVIKRRCGRIAHKGKKGAGKKQAVFGKNQKNQKKNNKRLRQIILS